jgi:hypothetical protein
LTGRHWQWNISRFYKRQNHINIRGSIQEEPGTVCNKLETEKQVLNKELAMAHNKIVNICFSSDLFEFNLVYCNVVVQKVFEKNRDFQG